MPDDKGQHAEALAWHDHLKEHLHGRVVILGVGNTMLGDDGVGSLIAQGLKGKIKADVFDCATAPENYIGKASKLNPDAILIIDASLFGQKAGDIALFESDDIARTGFSTHNSPVSMCMDFMGGSVKADILLLSVQPKSIAFDDNLTSEVRAAKNKIEGLLLSLLGVDKTQN